MKRLAGCIDRGMEGAREALTQVGHYVQDLRAVDGLLKPSDEATGEEREAPIRLAVAGVGGQRGPHTPAVCQGDEQF